jgi:ATP-binding cassette subfamily B (MDR/TAP) protein 1
MIGIRLSSAIRLHYLQRLFGQSIHVLDSMPPGYATGTITSTANVLQLGISEKLGIFVEYNSTIVAAIVVAFVKNWSLTLVTSSIILYLFLVLGTFLPMILKVNAQITKVRTPITRALAITDQKIRQRAEPVQSLVKRWQVLEW